MSICDVGHSILTSIHDSINIDLALPWDSYCFAMTDKDSGDQLESDSVVPNLVPLFPTPKRSMNDS